MAKKNNTIKYIAVGLGVYAAYYIYSKSKGLQGISGKSNRAKANEIEEHLIKTANSYKDFKDINKELVINIPKNWWKNGMAYNWNYDNREKPYLQGMYFYPNNKEIYIYTGTALKHIILPK